MGGNYKNVRAKVEADAHYIGDLNGEAGIYFQTRISPADIGRRLLALGEKPGTRIGPFRAQITYPDLSAMPWTVEAARDQIFATILKSRDPSAVDALCEVFPFEADFLAAQWHRLREVDETAAHLLLEGKLKSAFQRLPHYRWGEIGSQLKVGTSDVRTFLANFILIWVANDLQFAAEAARVKIYTPTGIPAIDGPDPTTAPKIDGVTKRIQEELELFDRVIALLEVLKPGELANNKQTLAFRNRGLDEQAEDFLEQWLCEIQKDNLSGADLEKAVFVKLSRGRRAVEHIAKSVADMRKKKPGSKRVTVNQGKWLYSLQTPQPLEQLYMACRYAASWCVPHASSDGSPKRLWAENVVDLLCGAEGANSRRAPRPEHPREVGLESEHVRMLFYIMRNAVVEDPTHLPIELGSIVDRGSGEVVNVRSNHEVRRVTGSKIPFSQIWGVFEKSSPYDSGQTNIADSVKAMLGPKPYGEVMVDAKRRSQGTVLQRLT